MSRDFAISNLIPKTVEIGNLENADTFRANAHERGIRIERHTSEHLLDKVEFSKVKKTVSIAVLRGSDLGFNEEGVAIGELRKRAIEQGYSLCPAELALSLRLAYLNQPLDERLIITMEEIRDNSPRHTPYVFSVEHYTSDEYYDREYYSENPIGLWLSHVLAFENGGGFFKLPCEAPFVLICKDK